MLVYILHENIQSSPKLYFIICTAPASASAQSDQDLHCPLIESLGGVEHT